jgi:4-hydroxybutyrate CoA-transferase
MFGFFSDVTIKNLVTRTRNSSSSLSRQFISSSIKLSQPLYCCSSFSTFREPSAIRGGKQPVIATSIEEAVSSIKSYDTVFVQTAAATPSALLKALVDRKDLKGVKLVHLHLEGVAPHMLPTNDKSSFKARNLFCGANARQAVSEGKAEFVPINLSEIPSLFSSSSSLQIDVALIQVSPPDRHLMTSLGPSVDITRAALASAKKIIAIINNHVPRTFGDACVHFSQLDVVVSLPSLLHTISPKPPSLVEADIGRIIATDLIKDKATLQLGIGSIPNAVLSHLKNHRDLSIWSEMISDGVIDLIESGVVTNAFKPIHTGRSTASFALGTQRLYSFLDDNCAVVFKCSSYVNEISRISSMPQMTSINSAIEIDITGQIVAESIGEYVYSGVGGAMDFTMGAGRAKDGVSIIAIPSTTSHGESRIVSHLKSGAGVVTPRAFVHNVVTENGIAQLFGKSLLERANALIKIAHPQYRDLLRSEVKRRRFG